MTSTVGEKIETGYDTTDTHQWELQETDTRAAR
jgi:hypothetical protein